MVDSGLPQIPRGALTAQRRTAGWAARLASGDASQVMRV